MVAERLGREHIELDRLHWGENCRSFPIFREKVEELVARDEAAHARSAMAVAVMRSGSEESVID